MRATTRTARTSSPKPGWFPGNGNRRGRTRESGITKEGSGHLRWVLVQAAWRWVYHTARWRRVFQALLARRGKKKAIVAVARRLLCVMVTMLQSGRSYSAARG